MCVGGAVTSEWLMLHSFECGGNKILVVSGKI